MSRNNAGVNIVDVIIVFLVGLLALFVIQSWNHTLANVFFTLAWVSVTVYLIALSGLFKNLMLRTPTWTITGLISLIIWPIVALIPIKSSTSLDINESNALVQLFGAGFVDNITQCFLIPWIETIIVVGLIIVLFLKQDSPDSKRIQSGFGKNKQTDKKYGFLLVFIALFGAIIHYNVGLALLEVGIGFDFFLLHQVVSFFIFGFIALSPLGLGGAIASHIVKNTLASGDLTFMFVMFGLFIILDVIAMTTNKKEDTHNKLLKPFGLKV